MKQAQNPRNKSRGRPAPRKGGGRSNNSSNQGNRSDNRPRGNPKQLLEKYKTQARDALQSGDRIEAEKWFQYADHYQRVLNDMQANRAERDEERGRRGRGRRNRPDEAETAEVSEEAAGEETVTEEAAVDPAESEQPVEVHPELDLAAETAVAEDKPKRRTRKPRAEGDETSEPKRRGRKPREAAEGEGEAPKRRGRKPKAVKEAEEAASAPEGDEAA
ncbi:DUF4167 domain-containing protein [Kordiimonas sp. SCSIO 12603]|uniref:DUF4167 domain-containing protein n=1 Tax=Kordiimonas sp. SCSIO 12603 TaxID=2829596 RepID=UPI0021058A10|nr:DUF4167 domain-containing protein [Kordiimonas sp. SCSIO 12603]UTW59499.1 DUF4167 domain-containing protein [Kordiimonas sp. SCSIO 12603]